MIDQLSSLEILQLHAMNDAHRHEHLGRCIHLAEFAKMVSTTKGQDKYLAEFKMEGEEAREQRGAFHKSLTPFAVSRLESIWQKVRRVDGFKFEIKHPNEASKKKITEFADQFVNRTSLKDYITEHLHHSTFNGPNDVYILDRENVMSESGVATGVEAVWRRIPIEDQLNWHESNSTLDWVVFKVDAYEPEYIYEGTSQRHLKEIKMNPIKHFVYYTSGLVAKLVEYKNIKPELEDGEIYIDLGSNEGKRTYVFSENKNGTKENAARKAGVYLDKATDLQTYVTAAHDASWILADLIETKSMFDLAVKLHVFPQKIAYVPKCSHVHHKLGQCESGYYNGILQEDHICWSCKGTGYDTHISGQDFVKLKFPNSKEEMMNLAELVHYVQHDTFSPEFLDKLIDKLLRRVTQAVFNSDIFESPQLGKTATEAQFETEKTNDVLYQYAKKIPDLMAWAVRIYAQYLEIDEGLEIDYHVPEKFDFKTTRSLLTDLGEAQEKNLPHSVVKSFVEKIIDKVFSSAPTEKMWVKAELHWMPFGGKSTEEIASILQSRSDSDFDRVFYENFSEVFRRIRQDQEDFIRFNRSRQRDIIASVVAQITQEIDVRRQSNPIDDLLGSGLGTEEEE